MSQVTVTFSEDVAKVAEFWLRADAGQAMEDASKEADAGRREAALDNLSIAERLTEAADAISAGLRGAG